jgi:hypothetical protein
MTQQMDWTAYGGSAAEIYERHMVPAIFGPSLSGELLGAIAPATQVMGVAPRGFEPVFTIRHALAVSYHTVGRC